MRHPLVLLTLTAALIVGISYVPWLAPLTLVALVPALRALEHRPLRHWIGGSAFCFYLVAIGAYYWVFHVSYRFGDLPAPIAAGIVAAFGLLNLWQGLVGFTLFRWLMERVRVIPRALLFALCFAVAWHAIPALFFWDFALLLLPWRFAIQGIDLCGGFGLDLFLGFFNYAVYEAWRRRRWTGSLRVAVGLLLALIGYGAVRVMTLGTQLRDAPAARVALIQPNLDSGAKAHAGFIRTSLTRLFALTATTLPQQPTLVVWPESVFPLDFLESRGLQDLLFAKSAEWQVPLLFGGNEFGETPAGRPAEYNSAFFITPTREVHAYQKHVLLAFGEYIPGESLFPFLRRWVPDRVGQYGRGPGAQRLPVTSTFSIAPVICYESIAGAYLRRVARTGATIAVELTNDGWYGTTKALAYHKDLARLRAIENRMGIARDTNTGITGFVDPLGNEHGVLPLEVAQTSTVTVPLLRPFSFFTHYGYLLFPMCGVVLLLTLLSTFKPLACWKKRATN